jgi:hypothetical protein
MRRNISAILILTIFLSLQFGKITTWLYCKWQAEIVLNQPDCSCDDHLAAMFQHDDGTGNGLSKIIFTEKINEYPPPASLTGLSVFLQQKKNRFAVYDSPLLKSFIASPFHPPAV